MILKSFQKNKKLFIIAALALFFMIVLGFFIGKGDGSPARPDQKITIPAMGNLPDLDIAMAENNAIRIRVNQLLKQDEGYLFSNYRQVNGTVAEILFLWAGMTPKQLQEMKGQEAINYFLRFLYGLPADDVIKNNPLLGKNPWPRLFNRFKAELLMQGQGYKIYDGLAYYDSASDKMVIEGRLSEKFMNGFNDFLKTKPAKDRKSYINNFLSFIENTKGIRNLSAEEKAMVKELDI